MVRGYVGAEVNTFVNWEGYGSLRKYGPGDGKILLPFCNKGRSHCYIMWKSLQANKYVGMAPLYY